MAERAKFSDPVTPRCSTVNNAACGPRACADAKFSLHLLFHRSTSLPARRQPLRRLVPRGVEIINRLLRRRLLRGARGNLLRQFLRRRQFVEEYLPVIAWP